MNLNILIKNNLNLKGAKIVKIQEFLSHFKNVKHTNNQFMALCPAHNDITPSLSIKNCENGDIKIHCHAGCEFENILMAVGLKAKDLYNNSCEHNITNNDSWEFVCEYFYTHTLKKVRWLLPDGSKQFTWKHRKKEHNAKWENGADGLEIPLYNQSVLEKVKLGEIVFVVEGEKDVDTLTKHGKIAVCSPHGATSSNPGSKWSSKYTEALSGHRVAIIQDNDVVGKAYAQTIALKLDDTAQSIKIVDLANEWTFLEDGGDITDVFEKSETDIEVINGLQTLEASTPYYTLFETAPTPFKATKVEPFPVNCLPTVVADYVKAVSENTQTPLEMSGVLMLGVLATVMQGKYIVSINQDYSEQLSLYAVAVSSPGERKSSVIKNLTYPINEYERKFNDTISSEVKKNNAKKNILEKQLKNLETKVIKKGFSEELTQELENKTKEIAEFKEINYIRLLANDATPEKLIDIMQKQDGVIALSSSEGNLFDLLLSKNDRGTTLLEPLLKGYSGDRLVVDRLTRESNIIDNPHISMILTIQPFVINNIIKNTEFNGRGLISRFLFVKCSSFVGERSPTSPSIPNYVKKSYRDLIFDLLSIKSKTIFQLTSEAEIE